MTEILVASIETKQSLIPLGEKVWGGGDGKGPGRGPAHLPSSPANTRREGTVRDYRPMEQTDDLQPVREAVSYRGLFTAG